MQEGETLLKTYFSLHTVSLLNRRKTVLHKFVGRTCLRVSYSMYFRFFPFLGLALYLYDLKLAYLRVKSLGKYDEIWKLILDGKMKTYLTNYHCPDVSAQKLNHYLAVMNLKKTLWLQLSVYPLATYKYDSLPERHH